MYLRKSTTDGRQNVRVQEQPLREWVGRLGYEPVLYSEPGISGAATSRPILDDMMKAVRRRELAAVCVLRLDRLGRSLAHLLQLLSEFESNGVRLLIHDMALDTATPHGKLFFSIIGGMAEYERALIAERVKDGIVYAKAHGTKSGRPIGRPRLEVDFVTICDAVRAGGNEPGGITAVAKEFGVSRAWIYKHVIPGHRWCHKHPLKRTAIIRI